MNLERRVEELETKLAFQEMTVDELNQELVKLNQVIAEQQQLVRLLVGKVKAIEPSNMAGQDEETPPPHY